MGQPRTGASIALAKLGSKRVAFVADEDARAVTAIDIETKKELASTPLAGVPSQLMIASDGRIFVLIRDRAELHVLAAENETGALVASCVVATAPEPVSLAASPDDKTLLVSSGWGRTLRAFELSTLVRLYDVPLDREPRAVVVSDDGATAYVSHAVGSKISAVDLKTGKHATQTLAMRGGDVDVMQSVRAQRKAIDTALLDKSLSPEAIVGLKETQKRIETTERVGCQGFALAKSVQPAGRVLAPQVLVDPGNPEGRPEGYGDNNGDTEMPSIAVIDEGATKPFEASLSVSRMDRVFAKREARDHREECLLPRAAAVDARSHTLFVACFGIDSVIAYDSASATPQSSERRRWVVGAGPSGIAVDPERPQAFVWSQFDRSVSVLPLNGDELADEGPDAPPEHLAKVTLAPMANKVPTDIALGRMIFHSGGDTRISKDGRACASCHPDGRDDALTWATPEGPRRSILLAGRVATTAPYSWNGSAKSLHDHITKTFDRLDGTGLRSLELDALITYISTMRPPVPPQQASADPQVARGAAIFASKEAQCSTCHTAPNGFEDGLTHDVMSKAKADRGTRFDTPSLKFVGGTGPYFHDGRYPDLHTLLRDVDGKMGHTKHLSEADLASLEAYLRTL